ncbi:hypothetical protein D3C87_1191520 [compost metagenome]
MLLLMLEPLAAIPPATLRFPEASNKPAWVPAIDIANCPAAGAYRPVLVLPVNEIAGAVTVPSGITKEPVMLSPALFTGV